MQTILEYIKKTKKSEYGLGNAKTDDDIVNFLDSNDYELINIDKSLHAKKPISVQLCIPGKRCYATINIFGTNIIMIYNGYVKNQSDYFSLWMEYDGTIDNIRCVDIQKSKLLIEWSPDKTSLGILSDYILNR